jgi:glycyl-tRNA synthetase beta chain
MDGKERVGVVIRDFLLELRSEEIPARMQAKACDDLARLFAAEIAKAGLQASAIETYATPRRLALIARGVPLETQPVNEETKGPKTSAPPQALEGFLRKTGLTQDQLIDRDGTYFAIVEKVGRKTSDVLAEAVPAIIRGFAWPKSMRWGAASATTESLRWVRPLQGIIALLGDDVVACEIDGIVSGSTTTGHRFHHHGDVTIGNAGDYAMKLRAAHVILDQTERQAIIRSGALKVAADAGLVLVEDEGLVIENAGLTEWPVPMLGRFDPAFLEVPEEVIQLTARVNQKYFVCQDADGKLANAFVCTANLNPNDGGVAVVAGNEKVLAARLSDAKFFWEADLKVSLEEQASKLSNIVFHEKLGSVADKVERVAKLARWLVESGVISPLPLAGGAGGGSDLQLSASPVDGPTPSPSREREGDSLATQAETAARLCKADLVSGMVGEFPELQGIMGGYYARAQGHGDAIADAIRDHYKPAGQGDDVPTAPVTVAVSLADKLDTLFCFFSRDMKPTGSKDPFALRRAALSYLEIANVNQLSINIIRLVEALTMTRAIQLFEKAYDLDPKVGEFSDGLADANGDQAYVQKKLDKIDELNREEGLRVKFDLNTQAMLWAYEGGVIIHRKARYTQELLDFFADRLKVQQKEAGVRHDLIDAVFALGGEDDLVRLLARVKALQAFVATGEGANLLAGYKRAANILKSSPERGGGGGADGGGPGSGQDNAGGDLGPLRPVGAPPRAGEDLALETALTAAEPLATAAIAAEDFEAAMSALSSLRAPIDAFFDRVMVNDPDPTVRAYRLGLLTRFRDAVHKVADFSKIEG